MNQSETSKNEEKAGSSELRSTASSVQPYTCSGVTEHSTETASPICSSSVIYKVGITVKAPTMCELNKAQDEKIVINVGGTRFQTSKSTLKNDPQCILAKMVCDDSEFLPTRDNNVPVYFIDRESAHFRFILNYLRNGCQVDLDTLPKDHRYLHEILTEARFYCCRGLERKILQMIHNMLCMWYHPSASSSGVF